MPNGLNSAITLIFITNGINPLIKAYLDTGYFLKLYKRRSITNETKKTMTQIDANG
jgi:hypothetical protein